MWRSLLWKEWHEVSWKAFYGAAIVSIFAAVGLRTRIMHDGMLMAMGLLIWCSCAVPLFISMGLFASEKEEGTLGRLFELPASRWRVFIAKVTAGAIACWVTVAAFFITATLATGGREEPVWNIFRISLASGFMAMASVAWIVAFAIRQPTEARAGLVGLAVFGFWGLWSAVPGVLPQESAKWIVMFHPLNYAYLFFIDNALMIIVRALPVILPALLLLYGAGSKFTDLGRER